MLERLTCVDAACTLSVAGSKCGAPKMASCVHEQHHLIHFRGFRHLQIYYSSPTTSVKNLDVGLQAAVPSYDARYFIYEVGGEARNNSLARNQPEGEESEYINEEPHEDTDATLYD